MEPGAALGTITDHVTDPIDVPDGPFHPGADADRVIHAWSASLCAAAGPSGRSSVTIFGPKAAWRNIWHEREGPSGSGSGGSERLDSGASASDSAAAPTA
jgi:hypothetical protein